MTDSQELTLIASSEVVSGSVQTLPATILQSGTPAIIAWDDFFSGTLRNRHTRAAYEGAVRRFFKKLPRSILLEHITAGMVGRYFDEHDGAIPTRKLHLAALRAFFDLLVVRHIVPLNPAAGVRGERYQVVEGKTPEITIQQARLLLGSIQLQKKCRSNNGAMIADVVGLRDRAIIATLFYTAARAGAVAKLKVKHLRWDGTQYSLRFDEKGNKAREIPVRADLQRWLLEYRDAAALPADDQNAPLFSTAIRRTGKLTSIAMTNIDVCRMIKRRLADASLPCDISPHSFRVATITDLLNHGEALESVQHLAGHADPRTTRLYDRRQRRVTRNLVERISNLVD